MKRIALAALVAALVFWISGAAPASAGVPKSIVGKGTTVVSTDQGPFAPYNVKVATVKQAGRIDVSGIGAKPVNCTVSWTRSGVRFAMATTERVSGRLFMLILSEGGGGHVPYALIHHLRATPVGGLCNTSLGPEHAPLDAPSLFQVPAKRYLVVGG